MTHVLWSSTRVISRTARRAGPICAHRQPRTWRTLASLSNDVNPTQPFRIPLIDFSPFLTSPSQAEKQRTADEIVKGFKEVGFVYLRGCGVEQERVERVFGKMREFFSLPQEKKDALAWEDPRANRGYVSPGRERVTQSTSAEEIARLRALAPDSKESMEIGREWDSEWKNRWPEEGDVPGFRGEMLAFFQKCHETHVHIMRSIALGLHLPEHFFDTKITEQCHNLRLLQYPAMDASKLRGEGQARAGAHSDYGTLTLLFQDEVGGLEVQNPHTKEFHPATPIPGTIVVNVGDLLSRWSNDHLRSTLHRVVAPPARQQTLTNTSSGRTEDVNLVPQRNSIAFFCNPNFSAVIDCLPTCVDEGGGKRYEAVEAGRYIVSRLADTYS